MAKRKGKKKNKNQKTPKEKKPQTHETGNQSPSEIHDNDSNPSENYFGDQSYEDGLQELMDRWRFLATQGREERKQSLCEFVRDFNSSDQTNQAIKSALNVITSMVTSLGYRLSRLTVDYLLVYRRYDWKEIAAKAHAMANTIRHISLGGPETPSPITDKFVSAVELVFRGLGYPKVHYNDENRGFVGEMYDHEVWVNPRENQILGAMFFSILFLEILFCFPFISGDADESEKSDSVSKVAGFVANKYRDLNEKMKILTSEISELRGDEWENEEELSSNKESGNNDELETVRYKGFLTKQIIQMWKVDMFD